ncbi:cation:proton antiporter, partial [Candidatus Gracilibacteria bacterium]|nr:cation:proton antiporter [Candidatus Gracilibacteria bacterium]
LFYGIPLIVGLLFGVIISATDPLAVGAILSKNKDISESKKHLIEGESILNDGFVVTVFGILLLIIFEGNSFRLLESSYDFLYHIIVAVVIGVSVGLGIRYILEVWKEEHFTLSMNMSLLIAFSSFALAETFHTSGIIAVFAASLAYGYNPVIEENNKVIYDSIWEYIEYVANSVLFFLLGAAVVLQSDFSQLTVVVVSLALGILIAARSVALIILLPLLRFEGRKFTQLDFWLLNLAGSRGAVGIALLLLIPDSFQYKDLFITLAFLIIVISLVINPVIMQGLLKREKQKIIQK